MVFPSKFSEAKFDFDRLYGMSTSLPQAIVPVHGRIAFDLQLRGRDGQPLEEYFRWQLIYSLIYSGLYPKDYIGAEVHFPKGSSGSASLELDGAIFDDKDWITRYQNFWDHKQPQDLEWLNEHLLAVIEVKRGRDDIRDAWLRQVKPAMRLKDPSDAYVLGIYYDEERLFLFHRRNGRYLRYDESKNEKGEASQTDDLLLELPDPYM